MNNSQENIQTEYKDIIAILGSYREGVAIDEIEKALAGRIERRTLQRRLKQLIEQGRISSSGSGRAIKYHLLKTSEENRPTVENIPNILPLSPKGKDIQHQVSQPQQQRHPVGYNRAFLEDYQPNITSYLTAAEKQRLAEIGITARLNEPAGTYAKEVLQRLLIDLSWNSSRMEGNTYSLLDTQRLIADGISATDKPAMEAQMILNHKDAIEFIVQHTEDVGFNRYTILNLHALLSNNLLPNPASSGRLRSSGVGITNSVFTPLGIPQLIEEMFELILQKAEQIEDPFEQAFFVMVQLPYLQPFDDVNKRVSRLAANIPLNRRNLSPLSFTDVPNDLYIQGLLGVYERNEIALLKDVFLWAYNRSAKQYAAQRQSLGEPDPFRLQYREAMRQLIKEIVTGAVPKSETLSLIKSKAAELPENDQARFIEAVETELLNLHEGNFARYQVRPSEFERWKNAWHH